MQVRGTCLSRRPEKSETMIERAKCRWWSAIVFSVLLLIEASVAANERFHDAPLSADRLKNPYAGQRAAVRAGEELYKQNCFRCHWENGEGAANFPRLRSGPTQAASDGQIFWFITHGDPTKGMPSFRLIPAQARWKIITYLKSLSSK